MSENDLESLRVQLDCRRLNIVELLGLPPKTPLAENVTALCGCVAEAIPAGQYISGLKNADLTNVLAVHDKAQLNAYAKVKANRPAARPRPGKARSNDRQQWLLLSR